MSRDAGAMLNEQDREFISSNLLKCDQYARWLEASVGGSLDEAEADANALMQHAEDILERIRMRRQEGSK